MDRSVFHVYWGTAGNSGLYLDEIYQELNAIGISQRVFVSYYYPFDYGDKIFFRRTDLSNCKVRRFRGYIRYLELVKSLFCIFFFILKDRPTIVNYSLIGTYLPVYFFLKGVKRFTHCKIVITCHDVLPFTNAYMDISKEMKRRKKLFSLADYLLVHNLNAKDDLYKHFDVDVSRVIMHLFPIMDLTKIFANNVGSKLRNIDFLFIGHLRIEKGFQILLDAWEDFHGIYPDMRLCIAGNLPSGIKLDIDKYRDLNIYFELKYLSDWDYCMLIASSRCVVLPYLSGTNSGVVSTVLSLNTDVLTSDISMFLNNPLITEKNMFKSGDKSSLIEALRNKVEGRDTNTSDRLRDYRNTFKKQVIKVYEELLK